MSKNEEYGDGRNLRTEESHFLGVSLLRYKRKLGIRKEETIILIT